MLLNLVNERPSDVAGRSVHKPFRSRVLVGFALAAALMILVAAGVTLGANHFVHSSAWVQHTHEVLGSIELTYSRIKDAEAAQRGYLVTGEVGFEQEFMIAVPKAREEAAVLGRLVKDNPEQSDRARILADLVEQRMAAATLTAQKFRDGGVEAARVAMMDGKGPALMRRIEWFRNEMVDTEQTLLRERSENSNADASMVRAFTYLGLAITIAILVMVARRTLSETALRERAEAETAVANIQLLERVQELHVYGEQTRQMSRYAGMLQSCRSIAEAIEVTRDATLRLLPDLGGAVHMTRASQDLVEQLGSWGHHAASSGALFAPHDCWALRRGQTYDVPDVHRSMICAHVDAPAADCSASCLCIPLVAHGDTMGFMYLSGHRELAVERRDIAVTIAEQLSLALANLRLQESLRVQSIRDTLTGLYNRRYLEESLERELARCSRRNLPLTVLMIDLDHFKRFNDKHGHDGGDALLSQAGRLLQAQCRQEDIACRYGGEEFTMILPEMDAAAALQRANRVREAIESLQVQHLRESLTPVTASIGLACFPSSAVNGVELLRTADAALYRAKREGRNRVVVG